MNLPDAPRSKPRRNIPAGPLLVGIVLIGASLYAFGPVGKFFAGKMADSAQCAASAAKIAAMKPLAKGEVAAVQVNDRAQPATPVAFYGPNGEKLGLEAFRGRAILLNLWATWCVPCKKEMPALDQLQGELGGSDFEVVAVNIDTRNPEKPRIFLNEIGVKRLAHYTDPSAKIFQDLKAANRAFGMPTTLLIDAHGCELAHLAGPAEWSSAEALALVKAALGR